jgi:hypothetical protein
LCLKNIV